MRFYHTSPLIADYLSEKRIPKFNDFINLDRVKANYEKRKKMIEGAD